MIRAVRADRSSFRTVTFGPGLNLVVADRTEDSGEKDTRNGVGKTTLIEIVHFCLGSDSSRGVLSHPQLQGWTFSIDVDLLGLPFTVSRTVGNAGTVRIEGDTSSWTVSEIPLGISGSSFKVQDWTRILGWLMFELPIESAHTKYAPTFRSLIPYFSRRGKDAFVTPFEHHRKQSAVEKQVSNAFLLGLSWEDAAEWQSLKDRRALLQDLQKAARAGLVSSVLGSVGELEATKVRLQEKLREQERALQSFKVHPQYRDIEQEADLLTREIHTLTNETFSAEQMLSYYRSSLESEREPSTGEIVKMYEESGLTLPHAVMKQLSEVQEFHQQLVRNRREYLGSEILRLEQDVAEARRTVAQKSNRRAELLNILRTHGALEEYSALQARLSTLRSEVEAVENRIQASRRLQQGRSELRIAQELLERKARADLDERRTERDRAIALFNANSEFLYDAPGVLVIDVNENGYIFEVHIERGKSDGIGNMKIFCYDLMLAELWSAKSHTPGVLIHDSLLYDPVDPRQVSRAIELAARKSRERGFQYICTMNSDVLATLEFSDGFDPSDAIRLRLTDETESGSLLGIRF
jgi:uncharacterized protein YydD (DUF2326 family)